MDLVLDTLLQFPSSFVTTMSAGVDCTSYIYDIMLSQRKQALKVASGTQGRRQTWSWDGD